MAPTLTVPADNNTLIDRYYLGEPGVSYHLQSDRSSVLFDIDTRLFSRPRPFARESISPRSTRCWCRTGTSTIPVALTSLRNSSFTSAVVTVAHSAAHYPSVDTRSQNCDLDTLTDPGIRGSLEKGARMANTVDSHRKSFAAAASEGTEGLRPAFLGEMPNGVDSESMLEDILDEFDLEAAAEVSAELVATLTASCTEDDFHNWDYDHIEFIIDLSNRYGFTIPRNLLNGLPEQLFILVDAKKLSEPGCD